MDIMENESREESPIPYIVSDEDLASTKAALDEIAERASDCSALVGALNKKIKSNEISTAKGISFLEVKNNLLLQYLLGLGGVISTKLQGKSIQGSRYVDKLVELRTILEKIRPIDQKLKYQVDKLLRQAADGKMEADPLRHRANLDNLYDANSDSEQSDEEKPSSSNKKAVYCPPKVAPQPYDDEDETPAKQIEKSRKKSINRTLIRELQEEFLDTPMEIHNKGDAFSVQLTRHDQEKQRFEETYMTRLPETKKDKQLARAVSTMGVLGDEITDFKSKRPSRDGKSNKRKKSTSSSKNSKKRFRKK